MKRYLCLVLLVVCATAARTSHAEAPSVNFLGPVAVIRSDDVVPVDIVITSAGKTINAANLTVQYDTSMLIVDRIQREQTVFDLWPEEPSWDEGQGTIHFVGGHPNGLVMIQARIATVYFRVLKPGDTTLSLDTANSGLYLNDGAGTKVDVGDSALALTVHDSLYPGIGLSSTTHPTAESWSTSPRVTVSWLPEQGKEYSYLFSLDGRSVPDDVAETTSGEVSFDQLQDGRYYFTIKQRSVGGAWSEVTQRRFLIDTTPPEPFQLIHPDPAVVDGKSILTWVSNDLMSGIQRSMLNVGGRDVGPVTSPLTIDHAWVGKTLLVTVTDQAGNAQSARWVDVDPETTGSWWWIASLLLAGVFGMVVFFVLRHRR